MRIKQVDKMNNEKEEKKMRKKDNEEKIKGGKM